MYIWGVDPGTKSLGFAVAQLEEQDIFKLLRFGNIIAEEKHFSDRIYSIGQDLDQLLWKYPPSVICLEDVFAGKNIQSLIRLSHIRGVCYYLAKKHKANVVEFAPKKLKKSITGNGNSSKEQMAHFLAAELKLSLEFHKLDATDALAMSYYYILQKRNPLAGLQV